MRHLASVKRITSLNPIPGKDRIVLYFEDTKKKVGADCLIHDALVAELTERFGKDNVVVK